ncbi:TPA: hypothetical protein N0F65_011354 [Lagenidium giganteum]|uniref:Uncharacterized protein n=1 Tax=Lagenidium giganteum TaxID=4803 RepID=A0AAV2Z3T2_9STRA|nr:TPA: hypothetical protein N0F65_011354 [Lagenidium giganteum]
MSENARAILVRANSSSTRTILSVSSKASGRKSSTAITGRPSLMRRGTLVKIEIQKELRLVRKNIFSRKPWRDGLSVMWIVALNSTSSIMLAWAVTYILAMGSPAKPRYPLDGSSAKDPFDRWRFMATTGAYFVLLACLGHLSVQASIMAKDAFIPLVHPKATSRSVLWCLLWSTYISLPGLLVSIAVSVGVMSAFVHIPDRVNAILRLHVYLLFAVVFLFALYAIERLQRRLGRSILPELARRTSRWSQRSSGRSQHSSNFSGRRNSNQPQMTSASGNSGTSNGSGDELPAANSVDVRGPTITRVNDAMRNFFRTRLMPFLSFNVAFFYLHMSSFVTVLSQWEIMFYSCASLLLKVSLQEATKRWQLNAVKASAGTIHLAITIPTIVIDMQIRMVFIRTSVSQSSSDYKLLIASSFVLVLCKTLFRVAKILRLRHIIATRLTQCKSMQCILRRVNSKLHTRDISRARNEYSHFLDWKNYRLRMHAAEVYADMHGEYISVGSTTAVVYFLTAHPMFHLEGVATIDKVLLAAAVQVLTSLVLDYILSVVEGVHEVPLYETVSDEGHGLRFILLVLLANELKLVKKNLWSRKPWRDGAHVMGLVIVNTLVALALAWATAFLYVVGAPWKPILPSATSSANRPPPTQVRLFSDAVVVYFVVLVSCGHLSMRAYMLSRASVPGMAIHSFVRNFVRVLASTSHVLILIAAIAIGFMELLLYIQVPLRTAGQFHLYVFFTLPLFYENYATRTSRIIHRRRVSEQCGPNASNSSLSSNSDSPMANAPRVEARTRRQRSALAHRIMGQLAFYVSFLYIFASSKIPRKADFEVLMYACGSLLLKILMQEAAKHIQLHDRMPSSTAIHYALMVPTVALDVQIRMAFLPSGKLQMQSAMMNSTAIVAGGAIFRIAKILRLRYVISSRLTKSRGMQRILKRVNSKLALKDLNVARNEYARFLDWKNYMLRVHAAEVYADMHGEYISIGCSTAAIVLFSGHPMYAIMVTPEQVTNQVIAATFQTCAGLVFDYVSSVIEGVHEVPLYESIDDEGRALRLFLRVILGALAVINIGVIALANVNEAILHQDS